MCISQISADLLFDHVVVVVVVVVGGGGGGGGGGGDVSAAMTSVDPRVWTKTQVLQWLNWAIHEFSLENVVRSQFCLSGGRLLQLSRDEFLRRAPPFVGDILFEHLEILQKGMTNI